MSTGTYLQPANLDEALALLAEHDGAALVAGGTDLVVGTRQGKRTLPETLVAIHLSRTSTGSARTAAALMLGALTTHDAIEHSALVRGRWTALADASAIVGSPATRHVGTLGGNLANASPAMETGAPLVVLGAEVELRSSGGSRTVPIESLWASPGRTTAAPGEMITGVRVPAPADGSGSAYVRLEFRRSMEIAVVGAAALVTLAGDGTMADARVALTAVAPTIVRSPAAEARAAGKRADARGDRRRRGGRARHRGADLGRPRVGCLPQGDDRGDRAPRDRRRRPARCRRGRPGPGNDDGGRHPMSHACTLKVNGMSYPLELDAGRTLLTVLRGELGLTGAKEGCDDSECGACMVLVDGRPVNSCSYLALQADGREITTVEGLANGGELHPLQAAFLDEGGVQCGFCTPGMLISAEALLRRNPDPSEEEVRLALGGNLCRCTGYQKIAKAVLAAAPGATS